MCEGARRSRDPANRSTGPLSPGRVQIGNTQETDRTTVNELVDETLLMELYGPPFAAAVQHAAAVMCSYNLVNGVYACENSVTLGTMLKGRYNFSGFVVSDCACGEPRQGGPGWSLSTFPPAAAAQGAPRTRRRRPSPRASTSRCPTGTTSPRRT